MIKKGVRKDKLSVASLPKRVGCRRPFRQVYKQSAWDSIATAIKVRTYLKTKKEAITLTMYNMLLEVNIQKVIQWFILAVAKTANMKIDDLDSALLYLYQNREWQQENHLVTNLSNAGINNDSTLENEILLAKLVKDGYVNVYQQDIPIRSEGQILDTERRMSYLISFEGILFLESPPRLLKNRPYSWNNKMMVLKMSWIAAKTIAIMANALIIVILGYLTLKKDDKIVVPK